MTLERPHERCRDAGNLGIGSASIMSLDAYRAAARAVVRMSATTAVVSMSVASACGPERPA